MKYLTAIPKAIGTVGFWKAFLYSFGSWLTTWIIMWLTSNEAYVYLGKYGWMVPLLNTIVVFFKQYFDALNPTEA